MTLAEWNQVYGLMVSLWPNTKMPTTDVLRLSLPVVAGVSFEDAQRVVLEASSSGDEWPPRPGQIVAAMSPLGAIAPWPEALQLVRQACGQFGRNDEAGGLRWLAARSPHTARFAAECWRELCNAEIDGPFGGAIETRWRQDYQTTVDVIGSEQARGQLRPAVRDRIARLEAAGPGSGRSEFRNVNFPIESGEQQLIEQGGES